jgi:hypothetical protein
MLGKGAEDKATIEKEDETVPDQNKRPPKK